MSLHEELVFWCAIAASMGYVGLHLKHWGEAFLFASISIIGLILLWILKMRGTKKVKYILLCLAILAGNGLNEIFIRSWIEFFLTLASILCAFIAGAIFVLEAP